MCEVGSLHPPTSHGLGPISPTDVALGPVAVDASGQAPALEGALETAAKEGSEAATHRADQGVDHPGVPALVRQVQQAVHAVASHLRPDRRVSRSRSPVTVTIEKAEGLPTDRRSRVRCSLPTLGTAVRPRRVQPADCGCCDAPGDFQRMTCELLRPEYKDWCRLLLKEPSHTKEGQKRKGSSCRRTRGYRTYER